MKKNFTIVPNELIDFPALTVMEKYLYILLMKHAFQKDSCFPSQKTLAKAMQRSERYIRILIESLVSKGFILKIRRGINKSNEYVLLFRKPSHSRKPSSSHRGNKVPVIHGIGVPKNNTSLIINENETELSQEEKEKNMVQLRKKVEDLTGKKL